ncbi:MAG: hypothetical protein H6728_00470 [Myxococcales bacterium]|nr:hypothetical protein [Myxococcales bacterium]MCB9641537.1 hypothetical protein [Myxococcales bacterium]
MAKSITFSFSSRLQAPREQVAAHAFSWKGVNEELSPWIRMSGDDTLRLPLEGIKSPGQALFSSILLLFGLLPFDLHKLFLYDADPESFFDERSSSLLQKRWWHRRDIVEDGEQQCIVTDTLEIEPRLPFAGPMVRWFARGVFAHRHKRLQKKFGGHLLSA